MTEELTAYAIKEILATIVQSSERIEIDREMQKTERMRIEAQKEALIEYFEGRHIENIIRIRCDHQERMELISIIDKISQKDSLRENDVILCKGVLSLLASSQQATSNALSAAELLQLSQRGQ